MIKGHQMEPEKNKSSLSIRSKYFSKVKEQKDIEFSVTLHSPSEREMIVLQNLIRLNLY